MKNKWLIGLLSGALAVTLGMGLVACGGDGETKTDAEIAKEAINTVKILYDKDASTPKDYTVIGQTTVADTTYPITWTVSSDTSNIGDYVKVGTMDASTKLVTIGITQGEEVVNYKLKASVTVGEATESAEFEKNIPAKAVVKNDGSEANPFTVTDARAIGESLANGEFYQVDGKNARVHIKGIVVNPGSFKAASGNYPDELERVFIADDIEAEEADQVKIQYILFNDVMENPGNSTNPLGKGDEIVVWGFIERYNDATTIYYAKEDDAGETEYPEITSWKKAEKTDADRVAEAKEDLKIGETEYRVIGTFGTLPAKQGDATITWALKATSDALEIADGKLTVKNLPETDAKATLVATITYGAASDTKEFEVTVGKAPATAHEGTQNDPYTVADLFTKSKAIVGNDYLGGKDQPTQIYAEGYVVKVDGWGEQYSNWTKVYIADSLDATSADQVQVYRLGLDGTYLKAEADLVVGAKITLCGYLQKYNGKPEVSNSGDTNVKAVGYIRPDEPVKVKGSAENPYTVTEALEIINSLEDKGYYDGDSIKEVYVKGVVVAANSITSFTIGETAESKETITVYGATLNAEGTFTKAGDLAQGAEITVSGALYKYVSSNKTTPEIVAKDSVKVNVVAYRDTRTDDEKAKAALEVVLMPKRLDENFELPEVNITGVTFEWTVTGSAAAVSANKELLEVTRGAEDASVTVKLSVKSGSATETKDYQITVKGVLSAGEHTGKLDFVQDFDSYYAANWPNSYLEYAIKMADLSDSGIKGMVTLLRASKQTGTITDRPTLSAQKGSPAQITVYADGASLKTVTFTLKEWTNKKKFSKITLEYSTTGTAWEVASTLGDGNSNSLLISDHGTFTYTADNDGVQYVRLTFEATGTTNIQVGLTSIDLTVNVPASPAATSVTPVAILPGKED